MGLQEGRRRPLGSCSNAFRPAQPCAACPIRTLSMAESGRLHPGATPIRGRGPAPGPHYAWRLCRNGPLFFGASPREVGWGGAEQVGARTLPRRSGLRQPRLAPHPRCSKGKRAPAAALIMPACAAIGRDSATPPALFRATGSTRPAGPPPRLHGPRAFCVPRVG